MTLHAIYTLSSSDATRITPNKLHSGMDITIQNISPTGFVYVGGEGVTTTDYGYRIMPNHAISFELPGFDELFLIGSANGIQAAVVKINLEK